MARNSPSIQRRPPDPQWVTVQMQIRVPWWRREQLIDQARVQDVSLTELLADAIDRVYQPDPPAR